MTDQEKLFHEAVETMLTMYKKLGLDPSTNGLFWANSELTRLRSENDGLKEQLYLLESDKLTTLRASLAKAKGEVERLDKIGYRIGEQLSKAEGELSTLREKINVEGLAKVINGGYLHDPGCRTCDEGARAKARAIAAHLEGK